MADITGRAFGPHKSASVYLAYASAHRNEIGAENPSAVQNLINPNLGSALYVLTGAAENVTASRVGAFMTSALRVVDLDLCGIIVGANDGTVHRIQAAFQGNDQ